MTRRVLLISLSILLLARQYVAAEPYCLWCDENTANQFMNCVGEKLSNNPRFGSIPKGSISDMKNSMLAASNAMTSTSKGSEMKMMNGAMAGEMSGLVKSQMDITGQSAHEVTAELMDMVANCYMAVTGRPHAHFVKTLGNAIDFMLQDSDDDYDIPTAVASASAQSGVNIPPNLPQPFAPVRNFPPVPFNPTNNLNPQVPELQNFRRPDSFPVYQQRLPFNQGRPLNNQQYPNVVQQPSPYSQPSQNTDPQPPNNNQQYPNLNQQPPPNSQPPQNSDPQPPSTNQQYPDLSQQPSANSQPAENIDPQPQSNNNPNQQIPQNNQPQQNEPLPEQTNQQRPFNNQLPPTFNRQPFNEQPMPGFNKQPAYNPLLPRFNQGPVFNQQPPTNDPQPTTNNQQPQIASGNNQPAQENKPVFPVNNFRPGNFPMPWNKSPIPFPENVPGNTFQQRNEPRSPLQDQSQQQIPQDNQFRNFQQKDPTVNRNFNYQRPFNTYQQIPSQSASSSAAAASNVPANRNVGPLGPQAVRENTDDPNVNIPQSPPALNTVIETNQISNPPDEATTAVTSSTALQDPLKKLFSYFRRSNSNPSQSGTSSASAEADSNSQTPRKPFWSLNRRTNYQPNDPDSSAASSDANDPSNNQPNQETSNAEDGSSNNQPNQGASAASSSTAIQAPLQRFWSYFRRPSSDPAQSTASTASAVANSNSQAPSRNVWPFVQRTYYQSNGPDSSAASSDARDPSNDQPNQETSNAEDGSSNNQPNQVASASSSSTAFKAPLQSFWSYFRRPSSDPAQSTASSASAVANSNSQAPARNVWPYTQRATNPAASASASSSVDSPPNNQPNQNSNAFASSADGSPGSKHHHGKRKHRPKINNVDSKESCALRFGETLYVQLTNSTTFPKVLGPSTPKPFALNLIPEVNRRAAIDSGYDLSADEIEALSRIYISPLPEGTSTQLYGEKISKSFMVPLFKTGLLGNNCEDEAKSIASNVLKYLAMVLPQLDKIKGRPSQSPSPAFSPQYASASASATSSAGSPAVVSSSNAQSYDYPDYNAGETTNDDSYVYDTDQGQDPIPQNPTTNDDDEDCDYDGHWDKPAEQEGNDNNQITSSSTAEASANSQSPFQSFWNLFQRPRTGQNQDKSTDSTANAEAKSDSQAPSQTFKQIYQGPYSDPAQPSTSTANANSDSNSQNPLQNFWSFFRRPNSDPNQSSASSASTATASNSQAANQPFWQRPNLYSAQSSASSSNAPTDPNSQSPRRRFWPIQRPSNVPTQAESYADSSNNQPNQGTNAVASSTSSQNPLKKLWSFFPRPNSDPNQSGSSPANTEGDSNNQAPSQQLPNPEQDQTSSSSSSSEAGPNAQSPFANFWNLFKRPRKGQVSPEGSEPAPGTSPSETSYNEGSPQVSNQFPSTPSQPPTSIPPQELLPNQNEVKDPQLNQGPVSDSNQPGLPPNQGAVPFGPQRPPWMPYPIPSFGPNQYPRFGPGPAQRPGPFENQGPVAIPNSASSSAAASSAQAQNQGFRGIPNQMSGYQPFQVWSQATPNTEQGYVPSSEYPSNEAPSQEPMEEWGGSPQDGTGETDYADWGMSPSIPEEYRGGTGGTPKEPLGNTDYEGSGVTPNFGQTPNEALEESQTPSPSQGAEPAENAQNPLEGVANHLVNSPDESTKSQIDQLKSACIKSVGKNGYDYNQLTSIMAQISKDMKNKHPNWSGHKVLTMTYFETIVACTQVLQNVATSSSSANAGPRPTMNSNSASAAASSSANVAPINRFNGAPETVIIRSGNFQPGSFPQNNEFRNPIIRLNYAVPLQPSLINVNAPNNFRQPVFEQRPSFSSASASASATENNGFGGAGK